MNNYFPVKRVNTFLVLMLGAVLPLLLSCDKESDPTVIKVSNTPITGTGTTTPGTGTTTPGTGTTTPGTGTTTPGTGTTTPGTGTTTPGTGTTTPGTGTTTPGTGTTTPGTGTTTPGTGTTTPGTGTTTPGTGTTTPGTGTTTPGTVNSNGDGGVPIEGEGTFVVKIGTETFKLSADGSSVALATFVDAVPPITTVDKTSIRAVNITTGLTVTIIIDHTTAGVFDIFEMEVEMPNGIKYNNFKGASKAKINMQTYTRGQYSISTKGTFDTILNQSTDQTPISISGSFNLKGF